MRSVFALKTIKRTSITLSAVMCGIGVILILFPAISAAVIARIIGVTMILLGISRFCGYLSKDIYRLAFQHDLAFGAVLIVLGALLLAKPASMLDTLCIAIGTVIIVDAFLRLQTSFDAKRFGLKNWWLILLLSIVTGILGACLLFRPNESGIALMSFFGISLIADGILGITTTAASVKILEDIPGDD